MGRPCQYADAGLGSAAMSAKPTPRRFTPKVPLAGATGRRNPVTPILKRSARNGPALSICRCRVGFCGHVGGADTPQVHTEGTVGRVSGRRNPVTPTCRLPCRGRQISCLERSLRPVRACAHCGTNRRIRSDGSDRLHKVVGPKWAGLVNMQMPGWVLRPCRRSRHPAGSYRRDRWPRQRPMQSCHPDLPASLQGPANLLS
jgi:hypothetical protein